MLFRLLRYLNDLIYEQFREITDEELKTLRDMPYNPKPGESASGFRMVIDKEGGYKPPSEKEIKVGSIFVINSINMEVTTIDNNNVVRLEGRTSIKTKVAYVPMNDLTKPGSSYIFKRDEDSDKEKKNG